MPGNRKCVAFGESVTLRAIFTDSCGIPTDVDDFLTIPDDATSAVPNLNIGIYDPVQDELNVDLDAEILGVDGVLGTPIAPGDDLTNANSNLWEDMLAGGDAAAAWGSGINRISQGFYEVTYTLPSGLDAETQTGYWYDIWVGVVNGITVSQQFRFKVIEKGKIEIQSIGDNTLVVILLGPEVAGTNGAKLNEEVQLAYSTRYNPYYASPDLVRAECGSWVNEIPDDTLSLMIHWSSIEADAYQGKSMTNGSNYYTARTKFVVYEAAVKALTLPADLGGQSKSLGDLMVERDGSFLQVLQEIKQKRDEWLRVLNAGGSIVPGQGLGPVSALPGRLDPNRPDFGRGWHNPNEVFFSQPSQRKKFKITKDGKSKFGW